MRILSYNIFNCFNSTGAFDKLAELCQGLSIDTLMLNEYCDNEDGRRLDDSLRKIGFNAFERGLSATRPGANNNCSAIVSRTSFVTLANELDLRLVAVEQDGLVLCAYHASPRGVDQVLPEIEKVKAVVNEHEHVLLAGDFNSLAAADRETLGYEQHDIAPRYRENGVISYQATERLLAAGFTDLNVDPQLYTVPTGLGRKVEEGQRVRLDYAMGKGAVAQRYKAAVLRGKPFDTMSDHYPLLITP